MNTVGTFFRIDFFSKLKVFNHLLYFSRIPRSLIKINVLKLRRFNMHFNSLRILKNSKCVKSLPVNTLFTNSKYANSYLIKSHKLNRSAVLLMYACAMHSRALARLESEL